MFLSKTNSLIKSKILTGYINEHIHCIKQRRPCLCIIKAYNYSIYTNVNTSHLCSLLCNKDGFNKNSSLRMDIQRCLLNSLNLQRKLHTESLPNDADVFGDLSYEKYEGVEMDEDELEEERFTENDAKIPNWHKLRDSQYHKLIISYISRRDLKQALSVLDTVKENRSKPTVFMFNLLIRAFSLQGDIKTCFKLYNKMKRYGLTPTGATYNSLINACAISKNTEKALEQLHSLRQHFYETNYVLNESHYTTLIKAYSWHKQITTAFEIADEVRDKYLISPNIYASLFHSAISDKENGLKYALTLWYQMRKNNVKPTIIHYNLLLRAIRDLNFGDLKVNDIVISKLLGTQVNLNETGKMDLLDSPPVLSISFLKMMKEVLQKNKSTNQMSVDNDSKAVVIDRNEILSQNLNDILEKNRLILFGGIENIWKKMENDDVQPDVKIISMLLKLLPPSLEAEKVFLDLVRAKNVKVDISFFNILIHKRNIRKQYKEAKDVVNQIQQYNLRPNIMTFGVLALGCPNLKDGMVFLEQMNNIGFVPNAVIIETLLYMACYHKDFRYILFLMEFVLQNKMNPSQRFFETIKRFEKLLFDIFASENRYNRKEVRKLRNDYNNFKILYVEWEEKIERLNKK
ncbi:pentatricopeptide repeat-containing protein 1, mitochondrial [Hylaeus anthracinus]|uniref:pentatricopeptide repeat-containing protein 1, mitochondrial n=1 Tax=Hylaeus anthracinus TaxID=313031 RepID=UPI0023BA3ACF|nr:pentatricopeptide repeat-containing protein 1, mitochondrial [Hylaeus anthracinus]XP_054014826.1 pentatricopeptide repeat-containing protein 1, mitochondrial [Hylaeus anthracinus]